MSYYVTTPIYYVNDRPHLGHAYTTIAADVAARFHRLRGEEVFFLTGTDEHGQKVDKAAKARDMEPQALTDEVSQHFRALVQTGDNLLQVTNDDFIRTTEARHKEAAQALWKALEAKGAIYKDSYAGWYAVRDEAYYQESELVDGKAPTGAEVEWVEEESYFFRLSDYGDKLLELYAAQPEFVQPNSRFNEVKRFVEGGLKDLSISRTTFDWGVDVPGDDTHVMYVWIDALTNYLTAVGYPDESAADYQRFWCAGEQAPVHIVGKDILRFHAVYWPAFLMAAELPLPKQIIAHGWWLIEGEKMSKSIGNVISPQEMIDAYGIDYVRYFLMREVPFGNDGNFAKTAVATRVNTELANTVGNLAQRSLSMLFKQCEGVLPEVQYSAKETELLEQTYSIFEAYEAAIKRYAFSEALEVVVTQARAWNEYIDAEAPWVLKKEDPKRMKVVLMAIAEAVRVLALLLQPFVPHAAAALLDQLQVPTSQRSFAHLRASIQPGITIEKPEGVFPRLSE